MLSNEDKPYKGHETELKAQGGQILVGPGIETETCTWYDVSQLPRDSRL